MKFKMTPLSGITLKLTESRVISAQSNPVTTYDSTSAVMNIARLIVVEAGAIGAEYTNVSLGMDPTSEPTRFSVQ